MHPKAVLISYNHPTSNTALSGTAIMFNDGLVLAHGTILVPLLHIPSQRHWLKSLLASLTCTVEPCSILSNNVKFQVFQDNKAEGIKIMPGEVCVKGAWKCPLVSKSVKTLFHDWTMGDVSRGKSVHVDVDAAKHLMAVFFILTNSNEDSLGLGSLYTVLGEPMRGQEVLIESTPFGSELFINSLSRGIVSNVLGCERCLILTDARTVSGCEGGPIFGISYLRLNNEEKGKVLGLVSCSLTWWRGEWVGFTIGVSLTPVLRRLAKPSLMGSGKPLLHMDNAFSESAVEEAFDETVVLVRSGCSWGSGVIVDASKGTVITCAHVVPHENNGFSNLTIFYHGSEYVADLIFRSKNNVAYDIAVLKVREPFQFNGQIDLSIEEPEIGETVMAAGFPLISEKEELSLLPTIVKGCVARVCPYMMQTTCCIQSGASGGAILRGHKLLGLIVCNAQDSSSGALFPHVNFAIPVSCFRNEILKYIETGETSHLQSLESHDLAVQTVWLLQTSKL